ncbi:MAG: type IV toxin-antitoxin system AbiEi family antitoxin domain-containing protein, partial [Dehalococcoidia bacterium]|nr:type IV toxin-antitoxin system AbiEi family antitoxin domain-containing protein [Dehalococcoidia bacterium]
MIANTNAYKIPPGNQRPRIIRGEETALFAGKALMAKLARAARGGLLDVPKATEVLGVPRRTASIKLAALARRGWLLRVRRGLYFVVPLEA